ncbi:MAG TPA: acylphosphatase, partial [Gemmataceae bacterium]
MERCTITICGIVQGVGFRPFVYKLATRLGLAGFVQNQTGSVLIEAEGEPLVLERFRNELAERPPPLAFIERFSWQNQIPRGERQFRIVSSESDAA